MSSENDPAGRRVPITPELVRQVADLVYQQWVRDLQNDYERARVVRGGKQSRRTPGTGR